MIKLKSLAITENVVLPFHKLPPPVWPVSAAEAWMGTQPFLANALDI